MRLDSKSSDEAAGTQHTDAMTGMSGDRIVSEMSSAPPSIPTPSSSAQSPQQHPEYRVVRKRNRVPLSCAECRKRK